MEICGTGLQEVTIATGRIGRQRRGGGRSGAGCRARQQTARRQCSPHAGCLHLTSYSQAREAHDDGQRRGQEGQRGTERAPVTSAGARDRHGRYRSVGKPQCWCVVCCAWEWSGAVAPCVGVWLLLLLLALAPCGR